MDGDTDAAEPIRPSISERAARRDRISQGGSDRYSSLLRALHAGAEMPLRQRRGRGIALEWHPIAWTLVKAAVVVAFGYAAIFLGFNAWRDSRTDTWTGPDASVTSGQRLADCPVVNSLHDDTFPTWVRFEGSIYRLTDSVRPVGDDPGPDYPSTGYALGSLQLLRVNNTPQGKAGDVVLVKIDTTPVGRVFQRTPDCG